MTESRSSRVQKGRLQNLKDCDLRLGTEGTQETAREITGGKYAITQASRSVIACPGKSESRYSKKGEDSFLKSPRSEQPATGSGIRN